MKKKTKISIGIGVVLLIALFFIFMQIAGNPISDCPSFYQKSDVSCSSITQCEDYASSLGVNPSDLDMRCTNNYCEVKQNVGEC